MIWDLPLQQNDPSRSHNLEMLARQDIGPTAHVGAANNDDGVLATRLEHNNGVSRRHGRNHSEMIEADPAILERAGDEAPVSVVPNLADEVGRVRKLGAARGLVGALAAGEGLAGLGG